MLSNVQRVGKLVQGILCARLWCDSVIANENLGGDKSWLAGDVSCKCFVPGVVALQSSLGKAKFQRWPSVRALCCTRRFAPLSLL